MTIGVFDSGKGGEFVAARLRELLPEYEFVTAHDHAHVPYGGRTVDEIRRLTEAAIQPLLSYPIVVIACNTITTTSIDYLRERYPNTRFVGVEPMVKSASRLSKTRHITMLATPVTLSSKRYRELVATYGADLTIDQPDASMWAQQIESDGVDEISFDDAARSVARGSDVIVLACTHYLAVAGRLRQRFSDSVIILEPSTTLARQIRTVAV